MTDLQLEGRNLGPVQAWAGREDFANSRFFAEYLNRLVSGRDLNVIVTASSETGVGKTTLAVSLALALDQHGWTAEKAAVGSAQEYDRKYDAAKPGSALILDEAEKAVDSRRGMASSSVTLSQSFAAKRYRQVFSILTAPSKSWIDKRLGSDAADYWIQCVDTDMGRVKGEARCYRLLTNEHYQTDYTKRTEYLHWSPLDDHPEFKALDKKKRDILEHKGEEEATFFKEDEVNKKVEKAHEQGKKVFRDRIIRTLNEDVESLTQDDIKDIVGLSKGRVNQIANEN
jgi:hypothetical protein